MQSQESSKRWIIFQGNNVLLTDQQELLAQDDYHKLTVTRIYGLGSYNQVDCVCGEIATSTVLPNHILTYPLRQALEAVQVIWLRALIKAYSVISWDRNHQYCGYCTTETVPQNGRYERRCPKCQLSVFPRISPSIIVLIRKGDELLMTRSHHFKPGVYGLVAGFVEPGENLEEAVHREVYEEIGLKINNLKYFSSQPWPFPDSLMVGFTADFVSGEIVIDPIEIESAAWYRYDQLPSSPATISISGKLIQAFVDEKRITHE